MVGKSEVKQAYRHALEAIVEQKSPELMPYFDFDEAVDQVDMQVVAGTELLEQIIRQE